MGDSISLKEKLIERNTDKLFTKIEVCSKLTDEVDCYLDFDEVMLYVGNVYNLLEEKQCVYLLDDTTDRYLNNIVKSSIYEKKMIDINYLIKKSYLLKLYSDELIKDKITSLDIVKVMTNSFLDVKSYQCENRREQKKKKLQ